MNKLILISLYFVLLSCSSVNKKPRSLMSKDDALIKSDIQLVIEDDMKFEGLAEGLLANIVHLRSKPNHTLQFSKLKINSLAYADELEKLYNVLQNSKPAFLNYLSSNFSVYAVFGRDKPGEAFVTSYFAPEIEGGLTKSENFSSPLYGVPEDMVIVRLDQFSKTYGDGFNKRFCKVKENCATTKKFGILRARRVQKKGMADEIVPYFSREEISNKTVNAPVLAWVDPIEAFFLQIQGSGFVRLANGKRLQLGYAGQNGHKYEAIGKYLFDVIPRDKMSLQSIEEHLRTLSVDEREKLLNKNPSFVFFKEINTKPVTYFGIETINGRTIATDKRYFPKGAFAFLKFKKPEFVSKGSQEPKAWTDVSRFVFDHDTGGAIKGGGRLDLFWGEGSVAKQSAGVIKHMGELYYFLPKKLEQPIGAPPLK